MKWQMNKTRLLVVGGGIAAALATALILFFTCGG